MSILENKTNDNPRKTLEPDGAGSFVTSSKNDTYAVSHPIPQSDYQYSWITSSILQDERAFSEYFYESSPDWLVGNYVLTGSRIISNINGNIDQSKAINKPSNNLRLPDGELGAHGPYAEPSDWLPDDSLSTKIEGYLLSPLDLEQDDDNNLRSRESVPLMTSLYLYGINGPGTWSSHQNIRSGEHPVARYYKKRSRLILMDTPRTLLANDGRQIKEKRNPNQIEYHEPYVFISHHPVEHKFDQVTDPVTGRVDTVTLKYSLSNNKQYFSNKPINSKLNLEKTDRELYDSFVEQYIRDPSAESAITKFRSIKYSQTIWPRAENTFLSKIRDRPEFYFPWKNKRSERNVDDYVNSMGETIDEASIWVLDARDNFATSVTAGESLLTAQNGTGDLQSDQAVLKEDQQSHVQYFYLTEETDSVNGVLYAGQTKFEAGDQAGVQPFENNHAQFVNKLRNSAKEYSLVPEFRISEHMEFYVDENEGNFLAANSGLLSVTGALNSDLSDTDFFRVFNTSDLLSNDYKKIKRDHEDIASPTSLKIKASAFVSFLPYDGLYPAQRSVQLATLFSKSYGDNIIYSGSTALQDPEDYAKFKLINQMFYAPGLMYNSIKSGIAVDFSVVTGSDDTELVTSDYGQTPGVAQNRNTEPFIYRYQTTFDTYETQYKIPFEALLDPDGYVGSLKVRDADPSAFGVIYPNNGEDPSAFATLGSPTKRTYKLGISNFLASVPDFFLKGQNFSNIISAADDEPNYFNFDLNKEYRARVYLRGSENYDEVKIIEAARAEGKSFLTEHGHTLDDDDGFIFAAAAISVSGSRRYSRPTFSMYDRPNFNYSEMGDGYSPPPGLVLTAKSGSYHHGGSAFGGNKFSYPFSAIFGGFTLQSFYSYGSAVYDTHTPPYYEGYAYADLVYKPSLSDGTLSTEDKKIRVSLDTLVSNISSSYYRYSTTAIGDYLTKPRARDNTDDENLTLWSVSGTLVSASFPRQSKANMQIDASLNILGRIKNKLVEYDQDGEALLLKEDPTAGDRLVVYPKFETPIYDYTNVDYEIPEYGAYSVAAGMWHQYGEDLTNENGLFMQVTDFPKSYLSIPTTGSQKAETTVVNSLLTASLADAIGLSKEPVQLGRTADKKTVSEAIVLIPFYEVKSSKKFFSVDQEEYSKALRNDPEASSTLRSMTRAMSKYVMPPQFNFKLYDGSNGNPVIEPFLMYFLEFSYDLDREDLKRIWHNLPPKISAGLEEKEVEIGQELLGSEPLSDYPDNLKWMVFKVKEKGEWNYYKKTLDSRDDSRFRFDFEGNGLFKEPDYSYNWPYDYFSLVDMAKIKVDVLFETPEEANQRRSDSPGSPVRLPTTVRDDIDIREDIRPPTAAPTATQAQTTSTIQSTQRIRDFLGGGEE